MKRKAVALISVLLLTLFFLAAWTSYETMPQEPRIITVTGDAEVRIVPDEVVLTLGVETWNKNLQVAKGQNDAIVAKVLTLSTGHGIATEHAKTDYVSIEPRYRNGYYEERDFIGFFVHKTVVLTLRDLTKFEELLADALNAGVNYVHGIQFRTTELRTHRDAARALAVRAAKEKAEALAGELGQTVGEPQQIQELQSGWWSGYNAWWGSHWGSGVAQNVIQETGGGASLTEGSIAPGQISVNAKVSVSFVLE